MRVVGSVVGTASREFRAGVTGASRSDGGYHGGRPDRRNDQWMPGNTGPNAIADMTLEQLRRRCRDLDRNNALIAGMRLTFCNAVVGDCGITARPMTKWDDLNKQIRQLYADDHGYVDAGRSMSEREAQSQIVSELIQCGELLLVWSNAPRFHGIEAGPAIEMIVAERIDLTYNGVLNGNQIRQGVEIDSMGRIVAYHVLKIHPNDGHIMMLGLHREGDTIRIPSDRCTRPMLRRQAGQLRGVPLASAVVHQIAFGERISEAALMAAMQASCLGLIIKGGAKASDPANRLKLGVQSTLVDSDGNPIRHLKPGMVAHTGTGVEIEKTTPAMPGPAYDATMRVIDRRNAAALGTAYTTFSRDFAGTTFSAVRADILGEHRGFRVLQQILFESQVRPLHELRIAHWIATGQLELTAEQEAAWIDPRTSRQITRCRANFPGFEWVNPQQEASALQTSIGMGIISRPDAIAERGYDPEEVLVSELQYEKLEQELRASMGLPPRQAASTASQSSGTQSAPGKDPDDETSEEEDEIEPARGRARRQ